MFLLNIYIGFTTAQIVVAQWIVIGLLSIAGGYFFYLFLKNKKENKLLKKSVSKLKKEIKQIEEEKLKKESFEMDNDTVILRKLDSLITDRKVYLNSKLNLITLAGMLDVAPNKLSQLISLNFQKSYNDYINDYRIDYACKLLRNKKENPKMEYVASACGFSYRTTFNIVFKKHMGVPPTEYRRNMK